MANPNINYDLQIVHGGADLRVEGAGTPNITAYYTDITSTSRVLANCHLNIQYSNIQWSINNDNSVTVTGNITSDTLVRNGVAQPYTGIFYDIWTKFDGDTTFSTRVLAESSGTYDLNLPVSFSITIPPQSTSTAASIRFFSKAAGYNYDPDEFTLGLIVTNPNLPDYRPGAIRDSNGVWQSHNRSGGEVHVRNANGVWVEERTMSGGESCGNPPSIRKSDKWFNQRKLGKE